MSTDIAAALARAATDMHRASTVEDVLEEIVRSAAEALPIFDHIGVSTVEKGGRIVNRAATSDLVLELDHLQYDIPEGPCVDSLNGDQVVTAPHIRHDQRWPRYVPPAARRGLRSQMAVRLHLAKRGTVGGLNLYSTTAEDIDQTHVATAAFFAAHASIALGHVTEYSTLSGAVETRQLIGQAIGILMERYRLTPEAASTFLWRTSSHSNVKVRDLAAKILDDTVAQLDR